MPRLGSACVIRYSTKGPAGNAMRLLNEHLRAAGICGIEENTARVLDFVNQHGKELSRGQIELESHNPPRGTMHMQSVYDDGSAA